MDFPWILASFGRSWVGFGEHFGTQQRPQKGKINFFKIAIFKGFWELLGGSWEGLEAVLGRFWEGFGRVLGGFREGFGRILGAFWEGFGWIWGRFCS